MSSGWNFAEVWEHNADRFPESVAQAHGDRTVTWRSFDERADGVALRLLSAGLGHQAKVAQYFYNCPEYLESMFATFKAGAVPVNTNYRYGADELAYLWSNADVEAVVFHGAFSDRCEAVRSSLPGVRLWLWVDDGSGPCPDWAEPYEAAATHPAGRVVPAWGRSPDDLLLLYTGGTTGMPKGVMWRQDDLIVALDGSSRQPLPPVPGWSAFDESVPRPGPRNLPAAPLMHGTGGLNAMWNLVLAGSVVTLTHRSLDVIELLDTIERHRINSISIVGDAFAKRIVRALDAEPQRWDISSLRVVLSSGAMWSPQSKAALLRHSDRLFLVDALGSSEAVGIASNITTASSSPTAGPSGAGFALGATTKVLTEDGREVQPGSGERGMVAIRGRTPLGYYKDASKSAATFLEIDGVRWTVPGDWAEVAADGSLVLYGRGSQCINTGGEKVYPEEVEQALKADDAVDDAAVVGLPDDEYGQSIVALVVLADPGAGLDRSALTATVKSALASFKAPRHYVVVDSLERAPNGKLDYRRLTEVALGALGSGVATGTGAP